MTMKKLGMVLFGAGFLAGAFFLVQYLETVDWTAFAVSLAVCGAGVIAMRWADKKDDGAQKAAEANLQIVEQSLSQLVKSVADINAQRESIGVYNIHGQLDATLIDDLNAFVEARESIIHRHGLDRYAQVMDAFAAGERALNRAWSASADGYIDEVWASLDRAERALNRAFAALKAEA